MKSVVTGGAGFIGSNLVDTLLNKGHEVIVIDNQTSKSNKNYHWNEKAKNYKLDISNQTNQEELNNIFHKVDYVFHMAADVSIPYCIENPSKSYINNVNSLCNVLESSRINGINRVVLSSTSAIYGLSENICRESDISNPLNPYSHSKLACEQLMKMYYDLYSLKTVSLRYFNVYGNRQPEKGQYAPVMGIFLAQKRNGEYLTIVGDGNQTRDFVHVSDVVDANITVALNDYENYGEVYNVGTSKQYKIKDIADMISNNQIHISPRPAEVKNSLADISKIFKAYGWKPKVKLEDWIKEHV